MTKKFNVQVDDFVKKATGLQEKFIRQFIQDLFYEIVTTTPVDTGFARGSWYVGINDTDIEHQLGISREAAKQQGVQIDWSLQLSTSSLNINSAKIGDKIYLMNNANYIMKLEYGASSQAPNGMVRVALSKIDSIAQAVAARIIK